jgi:hypothetical protein
LESVSDFYADFMSGAASAFFLEVFLRDTLARFADAAKRSGPFASGSGGSTL